MTRLLSFSAFLLVLNLSNAFANQQRGVILAPFEAAKKIESIVKPLRAGYTQQNQVCTVGISRTGAKATLWATEGLSGRIKFQSEIHFLNTTVVFSNASNDPESVVNGLSFDGNKWAFISSYDEYSKITKVTLIQNNKIQSECIFKM